MLYIIKVLPSSGVIAKCILLPHTHFEGFVMLPVAFRREMGPLMAPADNMATSTKGTSSVQ